MGRLGRWVAALVLSASFASPSIATVRSVPVRVKLADPDKLPVAGAPYSGELVIEAGEDVLYGNAALVTTGGSQRLLAAPPQGTLRKGQALHVPFALQPAELELPLELRLEVDGTVLTRSIDLRPESVARARVPRLIREVTGITTPPPRSGANELSPGRPPGAEPQNRALTGPTTASARNIRVHGRMVYKRVDDEHVGADGVWVRIYDADNLFGDALVADGLTDEQGNFDINFSWDNGWDEIDLKVLFDAENARVKTRHGDILFTTYRVESAVSLNFTGTDRNFGTFEPADDETHAAFSVHTNLTRNWRWYSENAGISLSQVDAVVPVGGSASFYSPFFQEINIRGDDEWQEWVHAHEYGHHFIQTRAIQPPVEYCNGVCDPSPPFDCGHCGWCSETENNALGEGWPDWIGFVQPASYASRYGIPAINFFSFELVSQCFLPPNPGFNDPLTTELFFAAVLEDISDSVNELDSQSPVGIMDRLSLGTDEIIEVVDLDHPLTPAQFFEAFKARFPQHKERLWETALNSTFQLDQAPPASVTNLTSSSHTVNVSSADPTIRITWTRAADDWSGPAGYSIEETNLGVLPDAVTEVGDVTSFTTNTLPPGEYFITVRTVDRAGNWSPGYASIGPFIIRDPYPANLTPILTSGPMLMSGWAAPFVPRPLNDATSTSVPAPATLPGDKDSTFWNFSITNAGESVVPGFYSDGLHIDGVAVSAALHAAHVFPGQSYSLLNQGPANVRGGRHAIAGVADYADAREETSEDDNSNGQQYVWIPSTLSSGALVTRSAPPLRQGGWEQLTTPGTYYNSDGMRFSHSGTLNNLWRAVWVHAAENEDDYDCRLHFPTFSADTGFATHHAYSSRPAGYLDAVIVKRPTVSSIQAWDVGVVNQSGGASSYQIKNLQGSSLAFGGTTDVTLGAGEMMALRSLSQAAEDIGRLSLTATVLSGAGPLTLAWFPGTFERGTLDDASQTVSVSDGSTSRMDLLVTTTSLSAVALYRDPKDGTSPVSVRLTWGRTPPDFAAADLAGWHSPLVPRPTADGTPTSVPLPDTLHGNTSNTRFNYEIWNDSPTAYGQSIRNVINVDGVPQAISTLPGLGANAVSAVNLTTGFFISGGRHTLSVEYDEPDTISERYEDNNVYGEQYVWSPSQLQNGVPLTRQPTPSKTGGWGHVRSFEPLYFDCDGLRMPAFAPSGQDGFWGGVGVIPGDTSDVNVRLHLPQPGTKNGFRTNLGLSSFGLGESDFSLVNSRATPYGTFDAGVLTESGSQNYVISAARSVFRGTDPNATFGPFTIGPNLMLDLHEVTLSAGWYSFEVLNESGSVNWGVSLHGPAAFHTKLTALGAAWLEGPGQNERTIVEVTTAGSHCVAVWKAGSVDLPQSGAYRLRIRNLLVCDGQVIDVALGPSGLVGLWRGEGNANDAKGSNHGALGNGATFVGGKVGQCFSLDGVDDYIDDLGTASTFAFIQNTGIFTIEGWIGLDDPNAPRFQTISANVFNSTQKGHIFGFDNSAGQHQLELSLGKGIGGNLVIQSLSPEGIIMDGLWHHVAVTGNGTKVAFYVDGVAYTGSGTMGAKSTGDATRAMDLGWDNSGSFFGGQLDEFAIYDRALIPEEIQAIYEAGTAGRCGLASSPASWNSLWQGTTGHYPDASCPWVLFDSADPEMPVLSSELLTLSTSAAGENLYYEQTEYLAIPDTLRISARLRVVSESYLAGNPRRGVGIAFAVAPDSMNVLWVGRDSVFLWSAYGTQGATAFVGTDDLLHTYDIQVVRRSAITVRRDGVAILSGSIVGTGGEVTQPRLWWGDGTGSSFAVSEWAFLLHNANTIECGTAAVAVPPGPGETGAISLHPYPNPGRGAVSFAIRGGQLGQEDVFVRVYDVTGRIVRSIKLGPVRWATTLTWDGSDDRGAPVSTGIYLLRLEVGGRARASAKTTLLR